MRRRARGTTEGAGERKLKKTLSELAIVQRKMPINHIRMVRAGISGSSILDTEARTSGKGESSSSMASKSNSILHATIGPPIKRQGHKTYFMDPSSEPVAAKESARTLFFSTVLGSDTLSGVEGS